MGSIRICLAVIFMFRGASVKEMELVQHLKELGNIHVTYGGKVASFEHHNYDPINAIDGKYGYPDVCECCAALIRPAWINIDLGEPRPFNRIHLFGRTDFHTQFVDLQITITTETDYIASIPISPFNNTFIVNASHSLQYVTSINVSAANIFTVDNFMTLCDVQIFRNENLTSQSSTWSTCVSDNAVNGERFTHEDSICKKCSATNANDPPWWELDLGYAMLIDAISVQGRTDNVNVRQSTYLVIYISNGTVGVNLTAEAVNNASDANTININLQPPRLARFINIKHDNDYKVITLCDVVVHPGGCPINTFGDRCSRVCNCKDRCSAVTGYCKECLPGWRSFSCEKKCDDGRFGEHCSQNCSGNCQNNVTCEHVTGNCTTGCKPGYDYIKDSTCNAKCDDGRFGEHCSNNCSGNCQNNVTCDYKTGNCTNGCKPGYDYTKDSTCNAKCDNGRFGEHCSIYCSGNCQNNVTCDYVTGHCTNGCKPGYDYTKDSTCNAKCSGRYGVNCTRACSENCLNNVTCNNVNGACPSGCMDGYAYAKDKTCTLSCLDSYGPNCTNACSTNCLNNDTCKSTNGECPNGCAVGYNYSMDRTCKTQCSGRYGVNCTRACSENCFNNVTCNNVNGACSSGCMDGYDYAKDKTCTLPCVGSYGPNCNHACSTNCLNNDTCKSTNGECPNGCAVGYNYIMDRTCKTQCFGYFGNNCSNRCHCKNMTDQCDPFNGKCASGCLEGWSGSNCSVDLNLIRSGKYNVSVSQSLSYSTCTADRAIDGLLGTQNTSDVVLCSMCSVAFSREAPWWQLQLDRKLLGLSVIVFGRKDIGNKGQSQNLGVYISNETFTEENNGTFFGIIHDPTSDDGEALHLNKTVFQYLRITQSIAGYMTLCEVKLIEADCPLGHFGELCGLQCNCLDTMDCDAISGKCSQPGCTPGWQADACDIPCNMHQYGPKCSLSCHCNGMDDCDKISGICPGFCDNGWTGDSCSGECQRGMFGANCSSECHCKEGLECNHIFGNCTDNQCAPGWIYGNCSKECEDGLFGFGCISKCHCKEGVLCDNVYGICSDKQCADGWINDNCSQECDQGFYGFNCSSECHCQNGAHCDHVFGNCSDNKCAPGWITYNCQEDCDSSYFGMNCSFPCHCREGIACDHVSGNCSDKECSPGWTGHNCSTECIPGSFGKSCASLCRCKDNSVCDHINGHCPGDLCSKGWRFDNCSIECDPGFYGENCSRDCNCNKCHHVNGSCALYSTQCRGGFRLEGEFCTPEDSKQTSAGAIGGGVGAALAVIIVIAVGLWFYKRRTYSKNKHRSSFSAELSDITKPHRQENAHENLGYADTDADAKIYETSGDYYSFKDIIPGIKIHVLWDYIREKTKTGSSFFEDEFSKLPKGLIHKHDVATALENRGKTRYREMYAYDHSRVPLAKNNPTDSEYINACFIHGFERVNKFIASQGPTENMIDDFWRMLWQQRVDKIAMLTNIIEMGTLKCLQYWPDELNGVCTYGGVEIKYAAIEETFYYNIRSFDIRRGKESRYVKQFHFKTWPDKDVPETTWCLVDFWRAVDTSDAANISPIVVHCSAGVGRTGTFIALDILITQARMEGSIRPLQMVEALRQQRVNMVQTKEQYKYLHEAVAEALLIGTHPVLTRQFASVVDYMMGKERESRTTRLEEQFNLIVKSVQEVPESAEEQSSGPTYGNMETVMSEIHAYRPQLQKRGSKFIQRLGAIFLPTVGNTNALLVCMSPTDQPMEEFWSLVDEHHVTTIISLASPGSATYETCQYLGARGSGRVGQFSVNYIHEKKNKGSVERTFSFRDENHEDEDYLTTIKQFQLTSWLEGHETPSDMQSFLDLIEEVLKWQPHLSDKRPILIHCQTGFMRCGLTALVLNEIQRIRKENGQINIVESFKTMKTRCRDLVHNKTQYRFCYEAILTYITNSGTYQNL